MRWHQKRYHPCPPGKSVLADFCVGRPRDLRILARAVGWIGAVLAEWIYELPDGPLIEGRGVQPDLLVALDWRLYGTANDPQIQAAIEVLESK